MSERPPQRPAQRGAPLSLEDQVLRQIETIGDRVRAFDAKLQAEALIALEHAAATGDLTRIFELVDHPAAGVRREVLKAWLARVAPLTWSPNGRGRWIPRESEQYFPYDPQRARQTPLSP